MLEDFTPSRASLIIAYVLDTFLDAFPPSTIFDCSDSESVQGLQSKDDSNLTSIMDDELDNLDSDADNLPLSSTESDPADANSVHLALGLMSSLM